MSSATLSQAPATQTGTATFAAVTFAVGDTIGIQVTKAATITTSPGDIYVTLGES